MLGWKAWLVYGGSVVDRDFFGPVILYHTFHQITYLIDWLKHRRQIPLIDLILQVYFFVFSPLLVCEFFAILPGVTMVTVQWAYTKPWMVPLGPLWGFSQCFLLWVRSTITLTPSVLRTNYRSLLGCFHNPFLALSIICCVMLLLFHRYGPAPRDPWSRFLPPYLPFASNPQVHASRHTMHTRCS